MEGGHNQPPKGRGGRADDERGEGTAGASGRVAAPRGRRQPYLLQPAHGAGRVAEAGYVGCVHDRQAAIPGAPAVSPGGQRRPPSIRAAPNCAADRDPSSGSAPARAAAGVVGGGTGWCHPARPWVRLRLTCGDPAPAGDQLGRPHLTRRKCCRDIDLAAVAHLDVKRVRRGAFRTRGPTRIGHITTAPTTMGGSATIICLELGATRAGRGPGAREIPSSAANLRRPAPAAMSWAARSSRGGTSVGVGGMAVSRHLANGFRLGAVCSRGRPALPHAPPHPPPQAGWRRPVPPPTMAGPCPLPPGPGGLRSRRRSRRAMPR